MTFVLQPWADAYANLTSLFDRATFVKKVNHPLKGVYILVFECSILENTRPIDACDPSAYIDNDGVVDGSDLAHFAAGFADGDYNDIDLADFPAEFGTDNSFE